MEDDDYVDVPMAEPKYPNFRIENTRGLTYTIKIYDYIEEPNIYKEHIDIIDGATEKDIVVLDIASDGGNFNGFLVLFNALMRTKAHTKAQVSFASSAGSMLMLSCDEISMCPLGYMMNHTYSSGSGYMKKPEIMAKAEFDNRYFKNVLYHLYKDFLSDAEIEQMDSGLDIYLSYQQVQERLKNWTPIRLR